jgi:hypothetical protein
MRLFHFSDQQGLERFEPRPVAVPSQRPPGRDWLNGPLVWAIDDWHQPMYLFPRDCPRILLWPVATTTAADLEAWWGGRTARIIAHIEWAWFEAFKTGRLFRYEFPPTDFECLDDAGMWISRQAVEPIGVEVITDLPAALRDSGVELRIMDDLTPLRGVWATTLHASGNRLRNAANWA